MYEVGMGVILKLGLYRDYILKGEIANIHQDADGETLVTVNYEDGVVKVYTENAFTKNRRIIVTEEVIW